MTRDEYIATEPDRDEYVATPDTDPEEDRMRAEDEAQQAAINRATEEHEAERRWIASHLLHCGVRVTPDRDIDERYYCSTIGCDYDVRVRPFGYAPGWTVHEIKDGREVAGKYTVVREAGHVDRERADALNRRVVR